MGDFLEYFEVYLVYFCFDLENRISLRFRFYKWFVEKGLSEKYYLIVSIVVISEKVFIVCLYGIYLVIFKYYFEWFFYRKDRFIVF